MSGSKLGKIILFISVAAVTGVLWAHQGEKHPKDQVSPVTQNESLQELQEAINLDYQKSVKPIFKAKCFDCHSSQTNYPIYYRVPIIKGFIDDDIAEAKMHLDMSQDFPFQGHGSPKEDLEAIRETVEKNEMPPFRYKILHWGTGLTKEDSRIILNWIDSSLKRYQQDESN